MPRRKGDDINFLELQLWRIARFLERIDRKVDEMSEGQAALDAAIQDVRAKADAIISVVTSILAKIASSPNAPDLTSETAALTSISDSLHGTTAAADAALEPAGFSITSVTPTSGPSGTPVEIVGVGFGAAVAVFFGGQAATSFAVSSDTLINAVPASAGDGSGSVTVQDAAGNIASGTFTNTDAGAPAPPVTAAEPGAGEAPPEPPPPGT